MNKDYNRDHEAESHYSVDFRPYGIKKTLLVILASLTTTLLFPIIILLGLLGEIRKLKLSKSNKSKENNVKI